MSKKLREFPIKIVVANQKAGTGKSVLAWNLILSFLHDGHSVGIIDLDTENFTTSNFFKRREEGYKENIPSPECFTLSKKMSDRSSYQEVDDFLTRIIESLEARADIILIDTPSDMSHLVQAAISQADLVLTPLQPSMIDYNDIAVIDPETFEIKQPSFYSEFIWEQKKNRMRKSAQSNKKTDCFEWIIVDSRFNLDDITNDKKIQNLKKKISQRFGCEYIQGLSDRSLFHEGFLSGTSVSDQKNIASDDFSFSHIAALQELRSIQNFIRHGKR